MLNGSKLPDIFLVIERADSISLRRLAKGDLRVRVKVSHLGLNVLLVVEGCGFHIAGREKTGPSSPYELSLLTTG